MDQARIIPIATGDEIAEASDLYRRVFGYVDPAAALNTRLLLSMMRYGGLCLGARDDHDRLVAFSYGWTGLDGGDPFHYSQSTVVDQSWQGRGLGRAMKYAQRDEVLARGMQQMRWSYDPMLSRNGHFNLDVLGGRSHEVVPDLLGTGEHRVIIRWDLTATAPVSDPIALPRRATVGEAIQIDEDTVALIIPATNPHDPELARQIVDHLIRIVAAGHELTSCRRIDTDLSAYLLTRSAA
ncbi:MAG: hypothetical protein L0G99_11945 [Propionibacteriales bacterium]|nr:hypothetical protein [Propionibacteriales bacterium]